MILVEHNFLGNVINKADRNNYFFHVNKDMASIFTEKTPSAFMTFLATHW